MDISLIRAGYGVKGNPGKDGRKDGRKDGSGMILVGIGGNLASAAHGSPRQTAAAAVAMLPGLGVEVTGRSSWYLSEPVPRSDQPWYVNAVAAVATELAAAALLELLLGLEVRFGRRRGMPNAARTLDLDLLDYDGMIVETAHLVLPHPRLHLRRFVLAPLVEIAPGWRHPRLGLGAAELLARLADDQPVRRLEYG